MARVVKPLTVTQIESTQPKDNDYSVCDGDGLYLRVRRSGTKTWIFKADSVRDFAWGSSRKFIWDAMPVICEGKRVMCMSFYAKEAYALYRKYSTKVHRIINICNDFQK